MVIESRSRIRKLYNWTNAIKRRVSIQVKRNFRWILLVILLVIATVALSGCVKIDETLHVDEKTESARYLLYRVNNPEKYLKFLEEFDEKNYEIVDISLICGGDICDRSDTVYSITYRRK